MIWRMFLIWKSHMTNSAENCATFPIDCSIVKIRYGVSL
jgi:hypothetical protein